MQPVYKTILSALLAVGVASAAAAGETPESKIGDRYPFLERAAQDQNGASSFALVNGQHHTTVFTASERALFERALRPNSW